ncbi:MAG: glycosyltransferase family 2 protein [Eubacteriales bacterium]|nr:glycosyltransferase family 2 protein [Eubacteriales bacterium]
MKNILYLVVPCYNEEEVLPETSRRLSLKLDSLTQAGKISPQSRVLLVDDGSKDRTWELISGLHETDPRFEGLRLSRNRGHQNALLAGLMTARSFADMTISLDADLQDDVNAIDAMVDHYLNGSDIVYGVRSSRRTDTAFKRGTAQTYYKLLRLLGADLVYDHADFRLMSRRALDALAQFGEVNLFLRGIVPMLGFRTSIVEYQRAERFAGESKYPLKKMLEFAAEGITSLTTRPLRFILFGGIALAGLSLLLLLIFAIAACFGNGFPIARLLLCAILFVGGVNLTALGVVGEYVGKIYLETKHRPSFLIDQFLHSDDRDCEHE